MGDWGGDFSHGHARLHVAYNTARLHRAHGRNNTSWHKAHGNTNARLHEAHGNTNARLHEAHGNIRPYYNAKIGIQNKQGYGQLFGRANQTIQDYGWAYVRHYNN